MKFIWRSIVSAKLYRIGFALFFIATLYLMFYRPSSMSLGFSINDKVAHAVTFFIMTLLICRGFRQYYGYGVLVGLALFGLLIEVVQYLLPWRSFSIADWLADIAGIVGYHILHLLRVRFVRVNRSDNHVRNDN